MPHDEIMSHINISKLLIFFKILWGLDKPYDQIKRIWEVLKFLKIQILSQTISSVVIFFTNLYYDLNLDYSKYQSYWIILTLLLGGGKFFDKILDCSAVVSLFLASIVFDAEILASALVSISSSSNKYNEVKYFLNQHISYAVVDFSAICWQKGQTLSISVGS